MQFMVDNIEEADIECPVCERKVDEHTDDEAAVCLEQLNTKMKDEFSAYDNPEDLV